MTRPFWQLPQVPTRTEGSTGEASTHACNCIGPQNGQPRCPCQMHGIVERDGRWVQLERDLGPVMPHYDLGELVAGITIDNLHGEAEA